MSVYITSIFLQLWPKVVFFILSLTWLGYSAGVHKCGCSVVFLQALESYGSCKWLEISLSFQM